MSQAEKELVLRFRPGVEYTSTQDGIDIDYRDQGCLIENSEHQKSILDILEKLKRGTTESDFSKIRIADSVLGQLDTLGLILKTTSKPTTGTSGKELSRVLALATRRVQHQLGNQPLANQFLEQRATRELLIGYAMEYYTLVKAAPSVLGSALNHELPPAVWRQIKQLFLTEHDHHLLLETSLAAVDISPEKADTYLPLPSTYALTAALSAYSRQHILSFIGCLYLFEEPHPEFNSAFVSESQRLGLPDAFWKPFIAHSDVNEEEAHADVTWQALGEYTAISHHEAQVVRTNVLSVSEILHWQATQISEHFSSPERLQDRFLART